MCFFSFFFFLSGGVWPCDVVPLSIPSVEHAAKVLVSDGAVLVEVGLIDHLLNLLIEGLFCCEKKKKKVVCVSFC